MLMWRNTKESISENTLKGTTTVALTCRDGVVMATDRRATMGFYAVHGASRILRR